MISGKLILYLTIGTLVMLVPIVIQSLWYKIKLWKSIIIAVLLTVSGTVGTYIMYFIENHWWGGTSFFGAVFFVPLAFIGVAYLLKLPYNELIDLCAPAECMMLVIMKVQCLLSGCCKGMILFQEVRFPSQAAELVNALVLAGVLLWIAYKGSSKGRIYPIYLILYGATRFILNFFREEFTTTEMIVPFGTIWSVVSVAAGVLWLMLLKKQGEKKIAAAEDTEE